MTTSQEEKDEEEGFSRGLYGIPFQYELEAMTDIELAEKELKIRSKVAETIIKNEWRRRDKIEQHKLNEVIINKQHQLNLEITKIQNNTVWRSSILAALCTIVGAMLGIIFSSSNQNTTNPEPSSKPAVLQSQYIGIKESTQEEVSKTEVKSPTPQVQSATEVLQNDKKEKVVSSQSPKKNKQ